VVDLGRADEARIELDVRLPVAEPGMVERDLDALADGVRLVVAMT
jgi:hypothetical protein